MPNLSEIPLSVYVLDAETGTYTVVRERRASADRIVVNGKEVVIRPENKYLLERRRWLTWKFWRWGEKEYEALAFVLVNGGEMKPAEFRYREKLGGRMLAIMALENLTREGLEEAIGEAMLRRKIFARKWLWYLLIAGIVIAGVAIALPKLLPALLHRGAQPAAGENIATGGENYIPLMLMLVVRRWREWRRKRTC